MNYKIVIMEDELPILNNIVQKLKKLDLPIEIFGAVTSAEDALTLFDKASPAPEILLTDIRTPGMSGLELCRLISEKYPQTKLLILTGYDDFKYAQQAIRLHISDYLLKPVNIKQLRASMETVCGILAKEKKQLQQRNLLMSISGQPDTEILPCSFGNRPMGICLVCIGNLLNQGAEYDDVAYFNELWEHIEIERFLFSQTPEGDQFWILPEKSPNQRFIITSFFDSSFPGALLNYITERTHGIIAANLCTCSCGIIYQDIWETAEMERTCLRTSLVPCHSNIYFADAARDTAPVPDNDLIQFVLKGIQNQQKSLYFSALHSCLQALYDLPAPQELLENTVKVIINALKQQDTSLSSNAFSKTSVSILKMLCCQTDYDVIYNHLYSRLSNLFMDIFSDIVDGEALSLAVKKYIEENYQEPVSMDSLTEIFHFSDSYIGRVFRSTYGIPPMKYLTSYRIEKAKELIRDNPALNIKLIGELVGYEDQRYFSRSFRNLTGLTPSEYKNKISGS